MKKNIFSLILIITLFGVPYNFITGKRAPIIGYFIGKVRSLFRDEKELNLKSLQQNKLNFNELLVEVKRHYRGKIGTYFSNLSSSNVLHERVNGFDLYFLLYVYGSGYNCVLINNKYRITGVTGNLCLFEGEIYYLKYLENRETDFEGSIFYSCDISSFLK